MKNSYLCLVFILMFCFTSTYASHGDYGCDISLQQDSVNPLKFTAAIRVVKRSSIYLNQDSVSVYWGNNNVQFKAPLIDTLQEEFGLTICFYKSTYTFSASDSGVQRFAVNLPSRQDGIYNIDYGYSENVPFYVESGLNLNVLRTKLGTKSMTFGTHPLLFDSVNKYIHLPGQINTYSSDSINFELVVPLQASNANVPVYEYPHVYTINTSDLCYVDSIGDFYWTPTQMIGIFSVAYKATEYSEGEMMYFVTRDFIVFLIGTVSVSDNDKIINHGIEVYPNPTHSTLMLSAEIQADDATVTLTNTEGRVVLTQRLAKGKDHTIDMSNLPEGMYFVTLQSAQQRWVKKIVKSN